MPRFPHATSRRIFAVAVAIGTLLAVSGQARAVGPVLTFIEAEYNGIQGATGLNGAVAVATSPDGLNVYVASGGDPDTLAVFSREAGTGELTFLEVHYDDEGTVQGIGGISDVTVSPDGKHVYTTAVTDNSVAVFTRTPGTGALAYANRVIDGSSGGTVLAQASGVVVSSNNAFVYVTGRSDDGVSVFSRNQTSGALTFVESEQGPAIATLNGPEDLVLSPDGNFLLVASSASDSINTFARSPATGHITFTASATDGQGIIDGLDNVQSLALSPDGTSLYAAGADDHKLAVFTRTLVSGALNFVEIEQDNVGGATALNSVNNVMVSPDGAHVYATSLEDAVTVFTRTVGTGALTFASHVLMASQPDNWLNNPRDLATFDGGQLYVPAFTSHMLGVLTRNSSNGALTYLEHFYDTPEVHGLADGNAVAISPTGNTVYVTSASESALAVFQRSPATGVLTFTTSHQESDGGGFFLFGGASGVTVSPDGATFYVIGSTDNSIVAAQRNATTGASLGVISQLIDGTTAGDGMNSPQDVEVSPDGQHVYVVSSGSDNAVTTFTRQGNGSVVFTDTIKDGQEGTSRLGGAIALAISANSASVYVAASGEHAVTVFSRTAGSGQLTHVEAEFDGNNGVTSLEGANDVALSPDQKNVYVTSADDSAVTVFTRDLGTGALTYLEHDGGQANSISNPNSVVVSPNGLLVFVTNRDDDKVVVFERDPDTGALTFLEAVTDNTNGVDGLNEATALQISPDGLHLYVTGPGDDALAVFSIAEFTAFVEVFLPFIRR